MELGTIIHRTVLYSKRAVNQSTCGASLTVEEQNRAVRVEDKHKKEPFVINSLLPN